MSLILSEAPTTSFTALVGSVPAELTIVIPTFNERENVPLVVERLEKVLVGIAWEVIFVDDDSPDGTADAVRAVARRNPNVRCLQRIGRRGLSSACIEGLLSSAAPYIAVMDGDLQHDETLLPAMLQELRAGSIDIVIGSRFVDGSDVASMTKARISMSTLANRLSRIVLRSGPRDPMSGFFMLKRQVFDLAVRNLSVLGFKILIDLFASSRKELAFKELPFQFRERKYGESKLDMLVAWEYLLLLLDKLVGHILPVRFVLFALIGALGVVVHVAVLAVSFKVLDFGFTTAQSVATVGAMTSNFYLNNIFTYRDRRLHGIRLLYDLLSFYAVCSIGAVANVGIASYVFNSDRAWWLAGIAGIFVGAVWNYTASSVFTWNANK